MQIDIAKLTMLLYLKFLISAAMILYSLYLVTSDLDGTHLSKGSAGFNSVYSLWCGTQQATEKSRMDDAVFSCRGVQC